MARRLSKLGFCSRAQAFDLIRAGRVRVNGSMRRDPESPTAERDRIDVDGAHIAAAAPVYLMLNKPRGLVTTRSDEKGRATIYDVLKKTNAEILGAQKRRTQDAIHGRSASLGSSAESVPWLAPVGRLDQASEGLLLLTNDSEWAARVADPAQHLDKTYHVQINRVAGEVLLEALVRGMKAHVVQPSELLRAKSARLIREGGKNSWIEIVLDEGRNRQIRRMLEALGVEVLRLVRVAIGPLALGDLAKGAWRELTPREKSAVDRALHITTKSRAESC